MTIPYGYAHGEDIEWCIHNTALPELMLCGRRAGFVPEVPPMFPQLVHERCKTAWFREGKPTVQRLDLYGACSVCGGKAALVKGGVIGVHKAWIVTTRGTGPYGDEFEGAWLLPEEPQDVNAPSRGSR